MGFHITNFELPKNTDLIKRRQLKVGNDGNFDRKCGNLGMKKVELR